MAHLLVLSVNTMAQTVLDGGRDANAVPYVILSVFSILIVLPIAPFTRKLHRWVTYAVCLVFLVGTIYGVFAFPFNSGKGKMKIYFQQEVEINVSGAVQSSADSVSQTVHPNNEGFSVTNQSYPVNVTSRTALSGPLELLRDLIVPRLPSSSGKNVTCEEAKANRRMGLAMCSWADDLLPDPCPDCGLSEMEWLTFNATKLEERRAMIDIGGVNTKSCRIYFDSKVRWFRVIDQETGTEEKDGYLDFNEGLDEIRLWSWTWGKVFKVEFGWDEGTTDVMRGRAACEWTEYGGKAVETGNGSKGRRGARIAAYEQLLEYLPAWASVTKLDDGLAEIRQNFII